MNKNKYTSKGILRGDIIQPYPLNGSISPTKSDSPFNVYSNDESRIELKKSRLDQKCTDKMIEIIDEIMSQFKHNWTKEVVEISNWYAKQILMDTCTLDESFTMYWDPEKWENPYDTLWWLCSTALKDVYLSSKEEERHGTWLGYRDEYGKYLAKKRNKKIKKLIGT